VQHERFRIDLLNPKFIEYIHRNTYYHWRDYKKNRCVCVCVWTSRRTTDEIMLATTRYRDAYLAKHQVKTDPAAPTVESLPTGSQ